MRHCCSNIAQHFKLFVKWLFKGTNPKIDYAGYTEISKMTVSLRYFSTPYLHYTLYDVASPHTKWCRDNDQKGVSITQLDGYK